MDFHAKMRKCAAAALALAMTLSVPVQAESYSAVVTAGKMAVYADAERTWPLGALPVTSVVTVRSSADGVAEIESGGSIGYAALSDLTAISSLATRVVVNTDSRVYQKPALSSRWLALQKGTEVNLLATNGPWAMVESGGIVAYTNAAHLTDKQQEAVPEAGADNVQDGVVVEEFDAKVIQDRLRVYKKAGTSSKCLGSMAAGTVVKVHAYCGGWAYIELDGSFGFAQCSGMERVAETEEAPQQQMQTAEAMLAAGYSVEQVIYAFLTKEMGLNTAAACGILANVEKECSFNVTAASYDGGYGICQWTGSRNRTLKSWCSENGFDYTTLDGQLRYLQYELEVTRAKQLKYLQNVENSPLGAYDAAYYFCYNFEVPASRARRSVERGNLAKDKYWTTYAV